jgi:glycosyltransferase involved in cell wall biosynthesis
LCRGDTELLILKSLKSRHRSRFEKKSTDWIAKTKSICGIRNTIDIGNGTSIHGGKRTNLDATSQASKPKVSIITVNWNCADGLEKTIKSVINQKSSEYEIEHIVIDGASTDNSVKILQQYEKDIDYFISEPDGGIYAAMNKGLSFAKGDIIAFLNSDDTYRRNATKLSVENIEKNRVDISYGAFAYSKPNGYNEVVDGPRAWDEALLIRGIPGGHGTFFATKETYNKVGGYREDMKIVSDYDWMIRAYLSGCSANPLPKILLEMTQGGISFNDTLAKEENEQLFTEYLGESDTQRIRELYALKYYLNWQGRKSSQSEQIRLLDIAGDLKGFEAIYSRALVKTVNRSSEELGAAISSGMQQQNKRGLNVCVAVTYLNNIAGGAERIAIEAANRLAKEGHAVTIICCHGLAGEPFYRIDDDVDYIDLANRPFSENLHKIGAKGWARSREQISQTMDANETADINEWLIGPNKFKVFLYKGFFKANSFDVIVSHMPSTYPFIALALAGEPDPPLHIAALHNSPKYKFYSELYHANSATEKRVWLATLGLCDRISVLFSEFVVELPERLRSKTFVLSNFIDSAFHDDHELRNAKLQNRKIVTIGRLVPQKNHKALIDAFALIKDRIGNWSLEIYGEGPLKNELEEYCVSKGLDPKSILLGRTESPKKVYDSAGIFVLPSHFEGFGLALVEAMSRGLPVVGFENCPGVMFIVENEINGLLVKKDEGATSLANAITKLAGDDAFRQNLGIAAIKSAEKYTLDEHVAQLGALLGNRPKTKVFNIQEKSLKVAGLDVAIMSTNPSGGAGIAALRLQNGLQKIGFSASMFSSAKGDTAPSFVLKSMEREPNLNPKNWQISKRCNLKNSGATIFSSELASLNQSAIKAPTAYDIINLHWVSNFLSPSSVKLFLDSGRPVVWTLHDMLPFTGGCHYTSGCENFITNCENCPQVINNYSNHPMKVLETKKRLWQDRITIISPSVWLANQARKSQIFCNSRIEVVPNGIDTMEYQPWDKKRARRILGLPLDKKIILFACHSHGERRKGFQEALMMLVSLNRRRQDLHLVTIGRPSDETNDLFIPNTGFGFLHSSEQLSMIYSACDVTLLPSLEDNLPNIILESLSSGTPVAGFSTGGIEDLIKDGITGYLAPTKDILALRAAIEACLDSQLADSCRRYAISNLDHSRQAHSYAEIFRSLVGNSL